MSWKDYLIIGLTMLVFAFLGKQYVDARERAVLQFVQDFNRQMNQQVLMQIQQRLGSSTGAVPPEKSSSGPAGK